MRAFLGTEGCLYIELTIHKLSQSTTKFAQNDDIFTHNWCHANQKLSNIFGTHEFQLCNKFFVIMNNKKSLIVIIIFVHNYLTILARFIHFSLKFFQYLIYFFFVTNLKPYHQKIEHKTFIDKNIFHNFPLKLTFFLFGPLKFLKWIRSKSFWNCGGSFSFHSNFLSVSRLAGSKVIPPSMSLSLYVRSPDQTKRAIRYNQISKLASSCGAMIVVVASTYRIV